MRFEVEHEFHAPSAKVADVLCDPAFHADLDLPDLRRPEIVSSSMDGTMHILRLRFEYVGEVDPVVRSLFGNRRFAWIQELRLDTATCAGTLSFSAEQDAKRLNGLAAVAISATGDGESSKRRIEGDVHIRVPIVGGTFERRLVPGIVRRLDVEAAALSRELVTR